MAKTKEEMLRAAKTKSIEAWLENHPANCSFTLYENSDGSISCSDSHDISAAKAYESDLRAELARRAAPKVEPPAPREPKAGEVWKWRSPKYSPSGGDVFVYWFVLEDGYAVNLADGGQTSTFFDVGPMGWSESECYAASWGEAVAKRAAEMGMAPCNTDIANENWSNLMDDWADAKGSIKEIADECVAHGFEKSGSAVEDRHFILGAIRELVAARDAAERLLQARCGKGPWKQPEGCITVAAAYWDSMKAEADTLRRRLAEAEAAKTDQWWDGLCAYLRDASVLPSHVKRAGMATIIEAIGGVLAENLALESRVQAAEEKISSVRIALDPTLPADDES